MQNVCCCKPKLTKLCWPGQRNSLDITGHAGLSKNICARLCLGIQWPLRKWIYLCGRGKGKNCKGPTVLGKVPGIIYYSDQVTSL